MYAYGSDAAAEHLANFVRKVSRGKTQVLPEVTAFSVAHAVEAYAAVSDWAGLESWMAELEVSFLFFPSSVPYQEVSLSLPSSVSYQG